jgi:hypothetical protein
MRPASLALLSALALGCTRPAGGSSGSEPPAPGASVFTVAAAMGECEDLVQCARECDAGKSDRCRRMAVNYEFGKGADRDEARATELYVHACGMGNSEGCLSAGRMYEFHHGIAADDARAVAFYTRSCDLDNPTGCANFAVMLERGRGVAKDEARAAELYGRACSRGAGLACERMKHLTAGLNDGGSP